MKHRLLSTLLLAASVLHSVSATGAETLRQAVASALARFPGIDAAQYRYEAGQAQVGQARAEWLPALNGTLGAGRERSRNLSTLARGNDTTLTREEAEINLSQLLFDGGAATGQVRRFAAREESLEHNLAATAEELAFRVGQAFAEVGRLRQQLTFARDNVGTHDKTLEDVTALADAGRGRRADVTQAEARRALAVSAVDQLTAQLAQAETTFRYFVGRLPGELELVRPLDASLPSRLEAAVEQAIAVNPVIRAAEKELDAAQYDRESTKARAIWPRLTFEAGASKNRDVDGIPGPNQERYAVLRLRYNFFRGFADRERVRENDARVGEVGAELRRVREEVERDVRQAWDALAADRLRLPQLALYARASSDVADAYRLQFQLGQRSLLDVLNAENERFNAAGSLAAGRAALIVDELRLLAAQGRLLDVLNVRLAQSNDPEPASTTMPMPVAVDAPPATCPDGRATERGCLTLRLDPKVPDISPFSIPNTSAVPVR